MNCLIALGSNLGDREANLRQAISRIAALPEVQLKASSRFHETAPVGGPLGQGAFLNAAALIETDLPARALLEKLLAIESELGRTRTVHWGSRTIDLDLLLYGDEIIDEPDLQIPHPRMHERLFVLEPASEVAGAMVHSRFGGTVTDLLTKLSTDR